MLEDPEVRRAAVADHLLTAGSASVADLAEHFGVSLMTVHRDLATLESRGVIRRFRGGASALPSSVFESSIAYRKTTMLKEKAAIANAARSLIEPGMSVMLDEGSTMLALAEAIREVTPLTVVTNHVDAMVTLRSASGIRLIGIGGEYNPNHDAFTGVQCIEAIGQLRGDILFISASALDVTAAYHQEQEVVLIKRALMRSAARRILLVDSSKLGKTALHRLAPLTDFDLLITDDHAPKSLIADLESQGIDCRLAALKDGK
jgi:DeoR/GlpR family transcriptional regulator of sugar metabolism